MISKRMMKSESSGSYLAALNHRRTYLLKKAAGYTSYRKTLASRGLWQWLFDHEVFSNEIVGEPTEVLLDHYNRQKSKPGTKNLT